MHPDLVAISNLWSADHAVDTLKAEHEALTLAVQRAQAAVTEAEAAAAATEAALAEVRKAERVNQRSLDDYAQKRDTTRRMIDEGTAPDYAAAERQLARCLEIVDQLETTGLELLERVDALDAELRAHREAGRRRTTELEDARAALRARDAALRAEMAEALARRGPAAEALPAELRAPYAELRRKKRRVVVNTEEGICVACRAHVGAQRIAEVALGRALHACPGCGGFLLP